MLWHTCGLHSTTQVYQYNSGILNQPHPFPLKTLLVHSKLQSQVHLHLHLLPICNSCNAVIFFSYCGTRYHWYYYTHSNVPVVALWSPLRYTCEILHVCAGLKWLLVTLLLILCSVLSKEIGITAVALCLIYDFFIVHKVSSRNFSRFCLLVII